MQIQTNSDTSTDTDTNTDTDRRIVYTTINRLTQTFDLTQIKTQTSTCVDAHAH